MRLAGSVGSRQCACLDIIHRSFRGHESPGIALTGDLAVVVQDQEVYRSCGWRDRRDTTLDEAQAFSQLSR
jgi:hypothetical protein